MSEVPLYWSCFLLARYPLSGAVSYDRGTPVQISYNFFDEAVNYLITLEPEIKTALKNADAVTVSSAKTRLLTLSCP